MSYFLTKIGEKFIGKITVIDAPCGAGKTSWAIQEMNRSKEKAYVYCTPFLDEIERIRPFRDRGRLKFNVWNGDTDIPMYLYDLVCACKLGYVNPENFLEGMERYYSYKSSNSLSVDHADNNAHNNTVLNLSLMDKILNLQKGTIVAGFKPPYYLNVIHCDGAYRVQAVFEAGQIYLQHLLIGARTSIAARSGGIVEMKLICQDAEDLVACLKMLYESTYEWAMMNSTPKEHRRENKDVAYWAKDINLSILAQKELAAMDREAFDVFSAVAADGSVDE